MTEIHKRVNNTINRNIRNSKGVETGGALVGKDGAILYALGPGPNAIRTPCMFSKDDEYTRKRLIQLRKKDPDLDIVGDWHLHSLNGLSGGDVATLNGISKKWPKHIALVTDRPNAKAYRLFRAGKDGISELTWERLKSVDYSRTRAIADPRRMAKKGVVLIGQGSGGSLVTAFLARTNTRAYFIMDGEKLDALNTPRHIGTPKQVGEYKVDISAEHVQALNPDALIYTCTDEIAPENIKQLSKMLSSFSMVLACSGSPLVNRMTDELCRKMITPVVYAGVFERASGGYVLFSDPRDPNSPCFNCIFPVTRTVQDDTNDAIKDKANRYGFAEEELHAQQGLWVDIGFTALLQAKMAIAHLSEEPSLVPGNFVKWDTDSLNSQWAHINRRAECSVCKKD